MSAPTLSPADREKRWVATTSVAAAVLLTGMKLVVGIATGSLGVLSEAAHSGLDLVAAGVTLWAVRAAARPADREHTYGHGKFENISALFETLLLLITCLWIIYEAALRLFFEPVAVDPSFWAFAAMGVSIVVDFSRSRALSRVARKYQSQALEADALHFSTDIWSSLVVIAGLAAMRVGEATGLVWLASADAVAALVVAAIVVWVSLRLGKKSLNELTDAVPANLPALADRAARVSGVRDVSHVRIRRSGSQVFADLTVSVRRAEAFERAHDIASAAEAAVREALPGADVVVHVEPVPVGDEDLVTTVRLVAARLGHGAHGIRLYEFEGRPSVELHLEVDDGLTLQAAHESATAFEEALRAAAADLARVTTHIEPAGESSAHREGSLTDGEPLRAALDDLRRRRSWSFAAHDLQVRRIDGELDVSFHCTLDPSVSITEAHALTEQLEKGLRERFSNLGRVLIHVEPVGVSGH